MNEAAAPPMLRERSEFGDNRSVGEMRTRSMAVTPDADAEYVTQDAPEADYDMGATGLYRCIEGKDWDAALSRLEVAPIEAKTWVSRREVQSSKIRWRLLPLHAVCIFRAPMALIEALIEVYAEGPKLKDDQGMLPLHLACRNGASKGVVLTLLSAFPESINVRDRKGRLPLDLVENSSSQNKDSVFATIKKFHSDYMQEFNKPPVAHVEQTDQSQVSNLLLTQTQTGFQSTATGAFRESPAPGAFRESPVIVSTPHQQIQRTYSLGSAKSKEVDYEHRTVLFRMILKKDWQQASARAAAFTEEAATWIVTKGFNGNLRFLPLHKACVLQPPASVIESLIESYPEGAESTDQDGWLPIHCACFYGASAEVMDTLLKANAKGAHVKDDEGRMPLHYACLKGASLEVVNVLLASHAKAANAKDEEGRLAIHHACSKGAPEAVIDALLKASPKGAQSKDDQGRLPLHHACRKMSSERAIRTLLRVYPRAAQIKDDQEKLAIHYACQHGGSPAIIHLLLNTYPEAVNMKNGFGHTPIAEVKALKDPAMDPVLKLLEKFKRDYDRKVANNDDGSAVDSKVHVMQEKISTLEKSLGRVGLLGVELKSELRKGKDPVDVLDEFADKLIALGRKGEAPRESSERPSTKSRSGTPGKSRSKSKGRSKNATPSKGSGLFGRLSISRGKGPQ